MSNYNVRLEMGDGTGLDLGEWQGEDESEAIEDAKKYVESNCYYEAELLEDHHDDD